MTQLKYLGAVDLTQYFVKSFNFSDADEYLNNSIYDSRGVQIDFKFSRRLLNQVLTVFMPTVTLIIDHVLLQYECNCLLFSDCNRHCLILHQLFHGKHKSIHNKNLHNFNSYFLYFSLLTLKPMSQ